MIFAVSIATSVIAWHIGMSIALGTPLFVIYPIHLITGPLGLFFGMVAGGIGALIGKTEDFESSPFRLACLCAIVDFVVGVICSYILWISLLSGTDL